MRGSASIYDAPEPEPEPTHTSLQAPAEGMAMPSALSGGGGGSVPNAGARQQAVLVASALALTPRSH